MDLDFINNQIYHEIEINEPVVISNNINVILCFYSNIKHNKPIFLIFKNYSSYKFGSPNDETLAGHPMYNEGLIPYKIVSFNDSPYIEEVIKIGSIHPFFKKEKFKDLKHYIFPLKDRTFECICESIELLNEESNKENFGEFLQRMNGFVTYLYLH